ncbi:MAG: hypothetical protein ABI707_14950 [Ferruginibacter sp.]
MNHSWYILFAVCVLMACNHPNREIKERIADADSMAINYFKGDGTMDTVVAVKIIRDKKKIEQLAGFISEHSIERNYKCGYDGSLHFFKMNQVIQDIDFRMNEQGCMCFSFLQGGKSQATVLSRAAKEMITSFRK